MPVKFECPKCSRKLTIDDNRAGQTVRCPACKSPIKVPAESAPLSLDDAEQLPPPAPADDQFGFDSDSPANDESDDRDDEEFEQPSRSRRKSKWTDVAAGIGGIQFGLIVLALAWTVIASIPLAVKIAERSLETAKLLFNLIIISLMIGVASAGCFCFGHISGGSVPDPRSKKLATWSLAVSALALLVWIAVLGILVYMRMRIEHFAAHRSEARTLNLIDSILFVLAVVAMWGAEMIFLFLLMRVAWLFDEPSLFRWAKGVAIALAVLLGAFVILMIILLVTSDSKSAVFGDIDRTGFYIILYVSYTVSLSFLGCYFFTLMLAKRVLISGSISEERLREDEERRQERTRTISRHDDDDEDEDDDRDRRSRRRGGRDERD